MQESNFRNAVNDPSSPWPYGDFNKIASSGSVKIIEIKRGSNKTYICSTTDIEVSAVIGEIPPYLTNESFNMKIFNRSKAKLLQDWTELPKSEQIWRRERVNIGMENIKIGGLGAQQSISQGKNTFFPFLTKKPIVLTLFYKILVKLKWFHGYFGTHT